MKNQQVDVSVIIPNYNYERYLRDRIESVLSQTYSSFELILLDDASDDQSVAIMNDYSTHPRVSHLLVNEKNSGSPFLQWQKGILLAKGKYIWIAESDDWAEPKLLERMVSVLEKYPDVSFCFVGSQCIDEAGKKTSRDFDRWTSSQLHHPSGIGVFEGLDYIAHNLYWRNYVYNASGVVFRKSCFDAIADYSCFSMRYSGDWLFWIEMCRQGRVVEIYEKLNAFRIHDRSTTKKGLSNGDALLEDMIVVKKIEEILPALGMCKKMIRRGGFYKDIKRLRVSDRLAYRIALKKQLGGNFLDYLLDRFSKMLAPIFPCFPTRDRDRL